MRAKSWASNGVLSAAVLLGGCTTSLSSNVTMPGASNALLSGFTYQLPYAQFDIQSVRRLTACPGVADADDYAFSLEVTSTRRFAAGADVTLDYAALSAPTKTTTFSAAQHENGMLRTVNAAADDRTGPVIENVVTGISRIALAGAGVAPSARAPAETPCSILEEATRLEQEIKDATKSVKEARTDVEEIEAFREARGELNDTRAQQLVDARRTLRTRSAALAELVERYNRLLEKITIRSTYLWPSAPETTEAVLELPPREAAFVLAALDGRQPLYRQIEPELRIIATLTGPNNRQTSSFTDLNGAHGGPIYVTPAQGRMRLCQTSATVTNPAACRTVGTPDVLLEQLTNLPQFGRFVELRLSNGPFENNSLTATFREDGSLVEGSFQSQRAAAEAASTTFANIANTVQATTARIEAADAAHDAAVAQAELTDLQRQQTIMQTQIAIQRMQDLNATQGELARVQAELELLEATAALERAQREREAAQTTP